MIRATRCSIHGLCGFGFHAGSLQATASVCPASKGGLTTRSPEPAEDLSHTATADVNRAEWPKLYPGAMLPTGSSRIRAAGFCKWLARMSKLRRELSLWFSL